VLTRDFFSLRRVPWKERADISSKIDTLRDEACQGNSAGRYSLMAARPAAVGGPALSEKLN